MKLRSLALAGVMALACALPAAAQTSSTLPVKDNSLAVRPLAGQQDAAGAFHYRDIMEGLTAAGAPDAFLSDGAGHQLVTLFGTPAVSISNTPTVNIGSIGGGATASAQGTGNGYLSTLATASASQATASGQASQLTATQALLQPGGKVDTVIASGSTDIGASIASSAAVTLAAANASRRGVMYENQATTTGADCWVSTVATATADFHSLKVPAGGLYKSGPQHTGTGAISVICPSATSGAPIAFYGRAY